MIATHHIFNFDVNGTVTLEDSRKKISQEHKIIALLAENTFAQWDNHPQPLSFKDYVYKVLLPGDKSNASLKAERTKMVGSFIEWLDARSHPLAPQVRSKYEAIAQKYMNTDGKIRFTVFPSFFAFLEKLERDNISYSIVFRTFGPDLADVVDQIEKKSSLRFTNWGKCERGVWILNGSTVEKTAEVFRQFLHKKEHFAIEDDWPSWNADGELARSGKPFYLDATGCLDGVKNRSWFLDDNITHDEKDIINPCEVQGHPLDAAHVQSVALRVDPLQAMFDDEYYCNLLRVKP